MKHTKGCLSFVPVPAIFEFGSWEQAVGARWEEREKAKCQFKLRIKGLLIHKISLPTPLTANESLFK